MSEPITCPECGSASLIDLFERLLECQACGHTWQEDRIDIDDIDPPDWCDDWDRDL
ncbi:MAG: hypothetical protein ACOC00_00060 [Halothiobacillaceae bacterium]